jgi:alkylhydroperoxidase/carboxymuconolactone decarboxylase family protein YurZ
MGTPTKAAVDDATVSAFTALALGETELVERLAGLREELRKESTLDPRSFALVKIAALVAIDAPPASFIVQVTAALASGATPRDILGVLTAIAPQVGMPRVVAAAPEIMLALELDLPHDHSS